MVQCLLPQLKICYGDYSNLITSILEYDSYANDLRLMDLIQNSFVTVKYMCNFCIAYILYIGCDYIYIKFVVYSKYIGLFFGLFYPDTPFFLEVQRKIYTRVMRVMETNCYRLFQHHVNLLRKWETRSF